MTAQTSRNDLREDLLRTEASRADTHVLQPEMQRSLEGWLNTAGWSILDIQPEELVDGRGSRNGLLVPNLYPTVSTDRETGRRQAYYALANVLVGSTLEERYLIDITFNPLLLQTNLTRDGLLGELTTALENGAVANSIVEYFLSPSTVFPQNILAWIERQSMVDLVNEDADLSRSISIQLHRSRLAQSSQGINNELAAAVQEIINNARSTKGRDLSAEETRILRSKGEDALSTITSAYSMRVIIHQMIFVFLLG